MKYEVQCSYFVNVEADSKDQAREIVNNKLIELFGKYNEFAITLWEIKECIDFCAKHGFRVKK